MLQYFKKSADIIVVAQSSGKAVRATCRGIGRPQRETVVNLVESCKAFCKPYF